MNKVILQVPEEIRYINDWKDIETFLPQDTPYIMNKTITGCGYTEYCINNIYPTVICSPRKVLLENKEDQHSEDENVLYLKDEYASFQPFDADLTKDAKNDKPKKEKTEKEIKKAEEYTRYLKEKIENHTFNCAFVYHKPAKFLVTYDSFRRIKETLGESIKNYRIVVDEFQSLFTDARFKSDTENEFLFQLKGLKKIIYLSATPMMDKYLEQLDEFKDLPYYELDWCSNNPSRVIKPILKTKQCRSIVEEANRIIGLYKEGRFERITRQLENGTFEEVYSKEAVIYVNSVKNICDIIRSCELKLEETNVLCSDDADNRKKVRDAFISVDPSVTTKTMCLGKVPKEGEPHKMFTLCTRTVYLGADFYSTNARSFIFSDANIDCLSVDISLDLPQILGRQRLDINPWKNYAEFYYKLNTQEKSEEEFEEYMKKKVEDTETKLSAYNNLINLKEKHKVAESYQFYAKKRRYKDDYVSVNERMGSDIKPIFNKLVMISEKRAFEIQQIDYADRFSMFNALERQVETEDMNEYIKTFYSFSLLSEKYKYLCSLPESVALTILPHLPSSVQSYYTVLGKNRIMALRCNTTDMKKEYEGVLGNQEINIRDHIIPAFTIGGVYSKAEVKKKLGEIYASVGYSKTPRAVDLGEYFIIKNCMITNKETGKRDNCYQILKIKEEGIEN